MHCTRHIRRAATAAAAKAVSPVRHPTLRSLTTTPLSATSLRPALSHPLPSLPTQLRRHYASKKKSSKASASKKGKHALEDLDDDLDEASLPSRTETETEIDIDVFDRAMEREVKRFVVDLDAVRIGRVNPALLEAVMVSHKGERVPLGQLAQVNVKDAHTLMVILNEEELTSPVDKSIRTSDLALNPQKHSPGVLKVPIPKLTQEYKDSLIKRASADAEKARGRIRNVRSDARGKVKKMKHVGEDYIRRAEKSVEEGTKRWVGEVDKALQGKVKEIEKA
ncbi:ribosome recycling factor domain-containing protein [Fimicolochytrium jonesii]|uniref:ribosome recycling factor domain-containing protein n=1 Tax=Fimicolochytrium jonesii TaxID=1396493 RepID=UPI0022FEB558|nr:ribosome recycling factor domain-containing protein [Fimicolochytrium jonesii]KAI8817996.1 ribosome recycling factor domain-containing protein [Fimicolochytrium jonesii]